MPLLHEKPFGSAAARGRRASSDTVAASSGTPGGEQQLPSSFPAALTGPHAMLTRLVLAANPIGDAGAEVRFRDQVMACWLWDIATRYSYGTQFAYILKPKPQP